MLHPGAAAVAARAGAARRSEEAGCRLSTLEHTLFEVSARRRCARIRDPGPVFRFIRSGDPRPLEPVLEHNRLDLVSLAAVMARAVQLARDGHLACRDGAEALALGRVFERAGDMDRPLSMLRPPRSAHAQPEVKGEALYRPRVAAAAGPAIRGSRGDRGASISS